MRTAIICAALALAACSAKPEKAPELVIANEAVDPGLVEIKPSQNCWDYPQQCEAAGNQIRALDNVQ